MRENVSDFYGEDDENKREGERGGVRTGERREESEREKKHFLCSGHGLVSKL